MEDGCDESSDLEMEALGLDLKVRFHLLEGAVAPTRGTDRSAAWDLYAREAYQIRPGDLCLIDTGIIAQAPPGHHFKIVVRSSMAMKRGCVLANGFGVIDEDYCGPNDIIKIPLFRLPISRINHGSSRPQSYMGHTSEPVQYQSASGSTKTNNWYGRWDSQPIVIAPGERIAQLLVEENPHVVWERQDDRAFAKADRGGFGSTGR